MASLVGGIRGERGVGVRGCHLIQPRVGNVTACWPQNPLNFSVRIRRFGASPLPRAGSAAGRRADGGGGGSRHHLHSL